MNMLEAEKLKKEFTEIEEEKKVTAEFQKLKVKNQQFKEDLRSAEAALKTREEQLKATERLHAVELEKLKVLIEAEEERTFKAYI